MIESEENVVRGHVALNVLTESPRGSSSVPPGAVSMNGDMNQGQPILRSVVVETGHVERPLVHEPHVVLAVIRVVFRPRQCIRG